jgi:hypothetical protein
MFQEPAGADQFNWWLTLYGVLGAVVPFAPVTVCEPDLSLLAYLFVILIITLVSIAFLLKDAIAKKARRCLSILSTLAIYWAFSAVLIGNYSAIRTTIRWFAWSYDYKAKVLAGPTSSNAELKHIEWDGWGWAGQDTAVFLVFDPKNSLSAGARSARSGKFRGIPCEVFRVRRLENHWYSAQLYTNETWNRCN